MSDDPGKSPTGEKNKHAVALSKLGNSKGGKLRAISLTPERRSEIAHLGALARWKKKGHPKKFAII